MQMNFLYVVNMTYGKYDRSLIYSLEHLSMTERFYPRGDLNLTPLSFSILDALKNKLLIYIAIKHCENH